MLHNNSEIAVMSWETRGNQRYYYRRQRVGGQVIAEYLGNGLAAELTAVGDEADRERRAMEAAEWRDLLNDDRQTADQLAEVDDLVRALTAGVMLANGYHTHRRQWRKMSDFDRGIVR